MLPWRTPSVVGCCLLVGGLAAGCSRPVPTEELSPTGRKLAALGDAYVRATAQLHRPPQNLQELLPTLKLYGKPEVLLRSENDNQNFEIVWGVKLLMLKAHGSDLPIVAYERTGKDGVRHVLRGPREVLLLGESELRGATFPADYKFPF